MCICFAGTFCPIHFGHHSFTSSRSLSCIKKPGCSEPISSKIQTSIAILERCRAKKSPLWQGAMLGELEVATSFLIFKLFSLVAKPPKSKLPCPEKKKIQQSKLFVLPHQTTPVAEFCLSAQLSCGQQARLFPAVLQPYFRETTRDTGK